MVYFDERLWSGSDHDLQSHVWFYYVAPCAPQKAFDYRTVQTFARFTYLIFQVINHFLCAFRQRQMWKRQQCFFKDSTFLLFTFFFLFLKLADKTVDSVNLPGHALWESDSSFQGEVRYMSVICSETWKVESFLSLLPKNALDVSNTYTARRKYWGLWLRHEPTLKWRCNFINTTQNPKGTWRVTVSWLRHTLAPGNDIIKYGGPTRSFLNKRSDMLHKRAGQWDPGWLTEATMQAPIYKHTEAHTRAHAHTHANSGCC